ncbi:hypothetical protein SAMN04489724_1578 [Algoriphagus locisalis]|uniref:Uncharacterized protein n=1 Tax=Algoriphagus locisalis TaxID=305507 RepID=A0A1I6ZZQ4_9BACT|nr:hypothetical protein SAMN04489724_1578 [Algoriphagus locisalis]
MSARLTSVGRGISHGDPDSYREISVFDFLVMPQAGSISSVINCFFSEVCFRYCCDYLRRFYFQVRAKSFSKMTEKESGVARFAQNNPTNIISSFHYARHKS